MRSRPLSQYDIVQLVHECKVPHWKGVYMRDDLPTQVWKEECGVLNLDVLQGRGTHWTSWYKRGDVCYYFDSYGLQPPTEFQTYMKCDVYHSTYQVQEVGDVICGHLSVFMLFMLTVCHLPFHLACLTIVNNER